MATIKSGNRKSSDPRGSLPFLAPSLNDVLKCISILMPPGASDANYIASISNMQALEAFIPTTTAHLILQEPHIHDVGQPACLRRSLGDVKQPLLHLYMTIDEHAHNMSPPWHVMLCMQSAFLAHNVASQGYLVSMHNAPVCHAQNADGRRPKHLPEAGDPLLGIDGPHETRSDPQPVCRCK